MKRIFSLGIALLFLFVGAPALATSPTVTPDAEVTAALDRLDIKPASMRTDAATRCGLLNGKVFFGSGEAGLEIHDYPPLNELAACMATGELAASTVTIVGYTDAYGPADFNEALAAARAEIVRAYLIVSGVSSSRLKTLAVGEATVSANDAFAPKRDRRVEFWVTN